MENQIVCIFFYVLKCNSRRDGITEVLIYDFIPFFLQDKLPLPIVIIKESLLFRLSRRSL